MNCLLSSLTVIGEYKEDGFIITDSMPEETKIQVKQELLETAMNELSTISKPQYHFKTEMRNLFNIPEFKILLRIFNWVLYTTRN